MAIHILIFVFGAVIGSFLNVLIFRYHTGESVIYAGSRCLSCGKRLKWLELVPVLSFLFQKGRCRQCHSKISWQYPIVEFLTGLIFVLIFWKVFPISSRILDGFAIGTIFKIVYYWIIFSLFIVISVYDIRHRIIPNTFVYTLIVLSFFSGFSGNYALSERIPAGVAFFVFFGLLWLVSKGKWMGLGDAKISLAIGWLLGLTNGLMAIILAFWTGALSGVFLLLFVPKKFKMKSRIPFGPFLNLGTLVAFLFGSNILQIYLNIIG